MDYTNYNSAQTQHMTNCMAKFVAALDAEDPVLVGLKPVAQNMRNFIEISKAVYSTVVSLYRAEKCHTDQIAVLKAVLANLEKANAEYEMFKNSYFLISNRSNPLSEQNNRYSADERQQYLDTQITSTKTDIATEEDKLSRAQSYLSALTALFGPQIEHYKHIEHYKSEELSKPQPADQTEKEKEKNKTIAGQFDLNAALMNPDGSLVRPNVYRTREINALDIRGPVAPVTDSTFSPWNLPIEHAYTSYTAI